MTKKPKHDEVGCYGDGAFGHQHTRDRCAAVLDYYMQENFESRGKPIPAPTDFTPEELIRELYDAEWRQDGHDEWAACEWLNEHAPFEGCYWGWWQGDFGLWEGEE